MPLGRSGLTDEVMVVRFRYHQLYMAIERLAMEMLYRSFVAFSSYSGSAFHSA
jgi:hypothetical protein